MKERIVAAVAIALLLAGMAVSAQTQGRIEPYQFTVADTGVQLPGSCGDFNILYDDVILIRGTLRYDKAGNLVKDRYLIKIIGQTRYYNSTDPDKFVMGGPGELEVEHILWEDGIPAINSFAGPAFKVILKGYGPIYLQAGHTVYDYRTGEVLFHAGPNAYLEQDIQALCDYLK